jgi:phosphoribosylanthranilate isomerase
VVRVKICGLTRVDEALACAEAGADWIGVNLFPGSPRFVQPREAARISGALPESVRAVGVFVNRPAAEVAHLAGELGLGIVQLHGQEPPEDLLALGQLQVIRAFRLASVSDWTLVNDYLRRAEALGRPPDAVLIDTYVAGHAGGTGVSLPDATFEHMPPLRHLILAGGLTPENVASRTARVRPWMVDVATGVEKVPGRKDRALVAAFIRAAHSALVDETIDKPPEHL